MRRMSKYPMALIIIACVIAGIANSASAYTGNLQIPPEGVTQIVTLEDGSTLVGRITEVRADQIQFQTDQGEITIALAKLKSIREVVERKEDTAAAKPADPPEPFVDRAQVWFPNPNRARLLIGPTARTLKAGDGYFYDLWIFSPGLAYGITDNFMISGGASVIPGADQQMFYIMSKPRLKSTSSVDLAVSVTAFRLWSETFYFGLGNLTYGSDNNSLTCALGIAFTNDQVADKPAAMVGGEYRLGRRASSAR
jgi:hypothetical protein